jgi:hypothetical protein
MGKFNIPLNELVETYSAENSDDEEIPLLKKDWEKLFRNWFNNGVFGAVGEQHPKTFKKRLPDRICGRKKRT